jgi:Rps23 Pro-64 3,4-dihydroxylase Tpa1-like proline 4-hydroxylase
MALKEYTMYSIFYDKEYQDSFEKNYKLMQEDVQNGKFNLTMNDYVKVYNNLLTEETCHDLCKDIKENPNTLEFTGHLSDSLRKGSFINTFSTNNSFTKKFDSIVENVIEIISEKYTNDVRPLYYSYGNKFNHYNYQILKYDKDDYFRIHHDHYAEILNFSRLFSICLYLNEDYEGGELEFPSTEIGKEYKFKMGDAIVFPSHWMFYHGVKPILSGNRYSIIIWVGLDLSDKPAKFVTK